MPKALRETTPLGEAKVGPSGRMRVHAITAGLGSSGYYSPDVLREAATNKLIEKGTPLFLDHASETERMDRPERSVRDIAAVFTEAATYDDKAQALVGDIQVFAPYRDLLTEMAPHIGLSISGSATDVTEGDVDGRRVPVIEGLARIDSVDWVTRAGRGGKVVELLESVRVNKRALAHGVSEATVNDTREALQNALGKAYGDDDRWVYVRDFDESTVWFQVSQDGVERMYGQAYTQAADGAVTLTGEREEVRPVTSYVAVRASDPSAIEARTPDVPVTRPGSKRNPFTKLKEQIMSNIEVDEAEHRRVTEAAGRVPTLETERDTAIQERDQARRELAETRARETAATSARSRVTTTNANLPSAAVDRIVAECTATVPLTTDGQLDEAALHRAVDAARTREETYLAGLAESAGLGKVVGFGASTDVTESAPRPTKSPWGRPLTEKGA